MIARFLRMSFVRAVLPSGPLSSDGVVKERNQKLVPVGSATQTERLGSDDFSTGAVTALAADFGVACLDDSGFLLRVRRHAEGFDILRGMGFGGRSAAPLRTNASTGKLLMKVVG